MIEILYRRKRSDETPVNDSKRKKNGYLNQGKIYSVKLYKLLEIEQLTI